MTNREIRIKRVRSFFIEAAQTVIEEEGLDGATVRKIAARAGYNGATLYNYFRDLNHLLALALSHYMGEYIEMILSRLRGDEAPFELYQLDWFVYTEESFKHPKEYYYLFFKDPKMDLSEVYDEYFAKHPALFERLPKGFQSMCRERNQYTRDYAFLRTEFPERSESMLQRISDMNILMYNAMLGNLAQGAPDAAYGRYVARFKEYFMVNTRDLRV